MKSLREQVRRTLTSGAINYAIVEETALGYAAVRLANNGPRLTNLPVIGAPVSPGEKVIVDYSAEGTPVVRPYTILTEDPEEEQLAEAQNTTRSEGDPDANPIQPPPASQTFPVIAGRATRSMSHTETYSISGASDTLTYTGWTDYVYQYGGNLFGREVGTFYGENLPGTYFLRLTMAIQPGPGIKHFAVDFSDIQQWGQSRRVKGMNNAIVSTATAICRLGGPAYNPWDGVRTRMSIGCDPQNQTVSVTFLAVAGRYPIFEYIRIAPWTSTALESTPYYWS